MSLDNQSVESGQSHTQPENSRSPSHCVEDIKNIILNGFDAVANCLNDEELNKEYSKKDGKINWRKMREIMRKELSIELKEEWERMWVEEELPSKLILLQNLAKEAQPGTKAWRPKTGDINPQKLALEKKKLLNEIEQLKKVNAEKEVKVNSLKETLTSDWNQISDLRQKICEHQKTMDKIQYKIAEEFDREYDQEIITMDSFEELKKNIQDTTLQGCLDDFPV